MYSLSKFKSYVYLLEPVLPNIFYKFTDVSKAAVIYLELQIGLSIVINTLICLQNNKNKKTQNKLLIFIIIYCIVMQ